jgi:hypothetical protein
MPVAEAENLTQRLFSMLGGKGVSVRVWGRINGPVAFGFVQPTIAIPPDFSLRFSREQREAMLAHELAHLNLGDPVWFGLADVLCALLWWHPLVWWSRRSFHRVCEAVADEASSLLPAGPVALAESLISLGRELALRGARRRLGVGGSGSKSELGFRVEALLSTAVRWEKLSAQWRWMPRAMAISTAGLLAVFPFQKANSGSIHELLAGCARESSNDFTLNQVGSSEDDARQGNLEPARAGGVNKEDSAVLLIEFAEIPDTKALPVERLFIGSNKEESASRSGYTYDLYPSANLPSQKNVVADRAITEGQIALIGTTQYGGLRQDLRKKSGVEWLSFPGNGTRVKSGRQWIAQMKQAQTIVFDVDTADGTPTNRSASVKLQTGSVLTGPEARILVLPGDGRWRLNISQQCTEFLGYDDPGQFPPEVPDRSAPAVKHPAPGQIVQPLPHFRFRESRASVVAHTGQTAIVRGPAKSDVAATKTQPSFLGRARGQKQTSRMYLFVSLVSEAEGQTKSPF